MLVSILAMISLLEFCELEVFIRIEISNLTWNIVKIKTTEQLMKIEDATGEDPPASQTQQKIPSYTIKKKQHKSHHISHI